MKFQLFDTVRLVANWQQTDLAQKMSILSPIIASLMGKNLTVNVVSEEGGIELVTVFEHAFAIPADLLEPVPVDSRKSVPKFNIEDRVWIETMKPWSEGIVIGRRQISEYEEKDNGSEESEWELQVGEWEYEVLLLSDLKKNDFEAYGWIEESRIGRTKEGCEELSYAATKKKLTRA